MTDMLLQASLELYKAAMGGVRQHLLREVETVAGPYMFLGCETQGVYSPRMTHLSCFLPGLLALGGAAPTPPPCRIQNTTRTLLPLSTVLAEGTFQSQARLFVEGER